MGSNGKVLMNRCAGATSKGVEKRVKWFILVVSVGLWLTFGRMSFALDEVKLHVSGASSPNALIFRFAKEKGFYREEGLELLPISAGMLQGIQGLIGGSFDFSQILGQGAGAILRGLPLKIE